MIEFFIILIFFVKRKRGNKVLNLYTQDIFDFCNMIYFVLLCFTVMYATKRWLFMVDRNPIPDHHIARFPQSGFQLLTNNLNKRGFIVAIAFWIYIVGFLNNSHWISMYKKNFFIYFLSNIFLLVIPMFQWSPSISSFCFLFLCFFLIKFSFCILLQFFFSNSSHCFCWKLFISFRVATYTSFFLHKLGIIENKHCLYFISRNLIAFDVERFPIHCFDYFLLSMILLLSSMYYCI